MNHKNHTKSILWQERITGWQESGMSQSQYCRENDLPLGTFYYWKRRLSLKQSKNKFIQVPVFNFKGEQVKLIIPGGIKIIFQKDTELKTINTILEAVCSTH